jgi:RHS repeat-associated protein
METLSTTPATAKRRLEFAYDNKWRRVQKKVYAWNGSTYQLSKTLMFLYDRWNLVAELDSNGSLQRSYLWGKDLSGSLRRAGGVGGLLAINDHTDNNGVQTHYACYDGNGNIKSLVNASDRSLDAQYEYGPFGELLRTTGIGIAQENPFKWSSKYSDEIGGLIYYGYRYYNSNIGRWINRDPLGNVAFYSQCANFVNPSQIDSFRNEALTASYIFVNNRVVANVDTLGLKILKSIYVTFNQSLASPGDAYMGNGKIDKSSGRQFQGLMFT